MSEKIRELVREKYAKAITSRKSCFTSGDSTKSSCCNNSFSMATKMVTGNLYAENEIGDLPADIIASSFGCGNPTALAELYAGEVVLDLGSGAGLDVLLSAQRVGPQGKAYGLDMTAEMLAAAKQNQQKAKITNVEFLQGHIEDIPLPANSVDVIISNCVINLSADKNKVLNECFRVLKPGGRMAVADIVLKKALPTQLQQDLTAWAGCVAGALRDSEYSSKLAAAGFEKIELQVTRVYDFNDLGQELVAKLAQAELAELEGALVSAFIRARKPKVKKSKDTDFFIQPARAEDLPQVKQLLMSTGLPTAGVEANIENFLLAKGRNGEMLAAIGLEIDGTNAVLRSLASFTEFRKQGIASELVIAAMHKASVQGVKKLYLMTYTAEKYLQKFGFKIISREEIPESLLSGSNLKSECPANSSCMELSIQ